MARIKNEEEEATLPSQPMATRQATDTMTVPMRQAQAKKQAMEAKASGAGLTSTAGVDAPNVIPEADKIGPTPLAVASKDAALLRNIEPVVERPAVPPQQQAIPLAQPAAAPVLQPRPTRQAMDAMTLPMRQAMQRGTVAGAGLPPTVPVAMTPVTAAAPITGTPAAPGRGEIVRPSVSQTAGAGWFRNEQTGEVVPIDPSGKVSAFNSSGLPVDPASVQKINTSAGRGMGENYSFQGTAEAAQRFNSAVSPGEYSPEAQAARALQEEQFFERNGGQIIKLSQVESVLGRPLGAFPKEQRPQLINSALHFLSTRETAAANMAGREATVDAKIQALQSKEELARKAAEDKSNLKSQMSPADQVATEKLIGELSFGGVNDNNVGQINELRARLNKPALVKTGKGDKIKYVPLSGQQSGGGDAAASWLKGTKLLDEQPSA
jgi:hypothetical protein